MNKKELRNIYLKKRTMLSVEETASMSRSICKVFFDNVDLVPVRSLHLFLPIRHKGEIDTWCIIEKIREEFPGIRLIVPKMEGNDLHCYKFSANTILEENRWGIPEPVNSEICSPMTIDMVLLPLLVFDVNGNRIGYGKGFYDRFLTTCRKEVIKIGLSFFPPEPKIEADSFDIPLNHCVTPERFYSF